MNSRATQLKFWCPRISHYASHYHYGSLSIACFGQWECWTGWSQPVNCINLHKHRTPHCTAEWTYCLFPILWSTSSNKTFTLYQLNMHECFRFFSSDVLFLEIISLISVDMAWPKTLFFPPAHSHISNHAKNPCSRQKLSISSGEFIGKPWPIHSVVVWNTLSTIKSGFTCVS